MDKGKIGITYNEFSKLLKCICRDTESYKDYLNELDSAVGDGDLGITVSRGFNAVEKTIETKFKNIGQLLLKAGMDFNNAASSTMGSLLGMALMRTGSCMGDKDVLDLPAFYKMIISVEESIKERGKAELGDKTMLDAIDPIRLSLKNSIEKKESCSVALEKVYRASEKGSENTKTMLAVRGRARWLGTQTIGHLDPGAVLISLIMKSVYEHFLEV